MKLALFCNQDWRCRILPLFFILLIFGSCSDDEDIIEIVNICDAVFVGDVILNSQSEVDAFGQLGHCKIQGILNVTEGTDTDPIVSLATLVNLREIEGGLLIQATAQLANLEGLDNLERVDELININNNFRLQRISSLTKASGSVSAMQIFANRSLQSLDGIQKIRFKENAFLSISQNDSLVDIMALTSTMPSKLKYLGMTSRLPSFCSPSGKCTDTDFIHQPFTEIPEFTGLEEVERILIRGYDGDSFTSFDKIKKVLQMDLITCVNLTDMNGFNGLTEPMELLQIRDNPNLASLNGLENLPVITDAYVLSANEILVDHCAVTTAMQSQMPMNYFVEGNAFDPTYDDFVMGNCSN